MSSSNSSSLRTMMIMMMMMMTYNEPSWARAMADIRHRMSRVLCVQRPSRQRRNPFVVFTGHEEVCPAIINAGAARGSSPRARYAHRVEGEQRLFWGSE